MRMLISDKNSDSIILIEVPVCDICYDAEEKQLCMLSKQANIGVVIDNLRPEQAKELTKKLLEDGFLDVSDYDAHPMHLDDDDFLIMTCYSGCRKT